MGRAAIQPKFVPINLNNSYGEGISPSPSSPSSSTSSSSTSSFGSALNRARPHGGMVLLTRPSKSCLSVQQTPMLASPSLLNLHKENARSVWSRQQAPVVPKSDLGPAALAVNRSLVGRLPLCTHECNESTHSPPMAASNDLTPQDSEKVPLLREEDFPSLRVLPSSHPQRMQGFSQQMQQRKLYGHDQERKQFQSRELKMHQGLDQNVWCKNDVKVAKDGGLPNSVTTYGERWADDERETLSTSTGGLEETPNHQDHGFWRGALGLNDQASRWDIQLKLAISSKESISEAKCLIMPFNTSGERGSLAHSSVVTNRDVSYQKNVPDSNVTQDDNWQSNKLKRLYGCKIDKICSMAGDGCLPGLEGGSFLQQTLEHPLSRSFLGNAKLDFNTETIFELKLKARRRKNEEVAECKFRDLARESFEAELEKVQKLLEQERLLVVDAQESKVDTSKATETEVQLQFEVDMENFAETRAKEVDPREGRPQSAREEERRLMLLEEERRKERATKKLLELEERIAKREAERRHFSGKAPVQEQLKLQHGPTDSVKLITLSSVNTGPLECSGLVSCKMTGQEGASSSSPGSLHDLDMIGPISEWPPPEEFQAIPALEMTQVSKPENIPYSHAKDMLVKTENFEKMESENESLENNEHGACTNTKDVSNGAEHFEKFWAFASDNQSMESISYPEDCGKRMEGTLTCDSEVCKQDCLMIPNGLTRAHSFDHLNLKEQDIECHEQGVEHLAVGVEFNKSFEQVVPKRFEKAHDNTKCSLDSSWHGTREGLTAHEALPERLFFLLPSDGSDAFSSQQSFGQGLKQPIPLPSTESACFSVSKDDHQEQHSMDMHSTAPFMLHAIQIGSIQMPLSDANSWMLQLASLHSLQFGQLCSAPIDQPLLTVGSTLPKHYMVGQAHEVEAETCFYIQQATDLEQKGDQVSLSAKESSLLSGLDQISRQADFREDSVIQFGDLSSSLLHKQMSTGRLSSSLFQANEKSPQHHENAQFSPSQGTACNHVKEKHVLNGQVPCLNIEHVADDCALVPGVSSKEQNQGLLMAHGLGKSQVRKHESFPAIPGRKKRDIAGTYAGVGERKYWRTSTMKMKYVKVSHRVMPGLEAHHSPMQYRSIGRFVYKKKELPDSENIYQTKQETVHFFSSNAITMLQNQDLRESGASHNKTAVSMHNSVATAKSESLRKKPPLVASEDLAMQYGAACVFKQQGIDTPYTADDFIEVKSRRQMIRKQRKEEGETKPLKTAAHQQRLLKVVQPQRDQWSQHN